MAEAAFLQPTKSNSTALTVVILMHAAVLGALAMSKIDVVKKTIPTIDIFRVDPEPKPLPPEPPKPMEKVQPPNTPPLTAPPVVVQLPPLNQGPVVEPTPIREVELTTRADESTPSLPEGDPVDLTPPTPKKVEPARAKANLASYVTDADYPAAAIRAEEQGTTRFRLTVGADGKVADCTVTGSSGSSALDSKTCSIMQKRARFTPAQDSAGNKVGDTVSNAIRWVLPE